MSTLISGVGIAFYRGADFAATCTAFVPVILMVMVVFGAQIKKSTIAKIIVVKQLCGVVEESLTAIRLIASFANEDREQKKFEAIAKRNLDLATSSYIKTAIIFGFFRMMIFGYYCYSFYIASIWIEQGRLNPC